MVHFFSVFLIWVGLVAGADEGRLKIHCSRTETDENGIAMRVEIFNTLNSSELYYSKHPADREPQESEIQTFIVTGMAIEAPLAHIDAVRFLTNEEQIDLTFRLPLVTENGRKLFDKEHSYLVQVTTSLRDGSLMCVQTRHEFVCDQVEEVLPAEAADPIPKPVAFHRSIPIRPVRL